MRFRISYDLPNLTLDGRVWPVNDQIIDIPPSLEPELRKAFPLAEELTGAVDNPSPPAPGTDPRRKV
jgi:hypothetical protein